MTAGARQRDNGDSPFVKMSHADLSNHFVVGEVAAFAVYNSLVIAVPASKLAQSNDEAVVHGSFYAQKRDNGDCPLCHVCGIM